MASKVQPMTGSKISSGSQAQAETSTLFCFVSWWLSYFPRLPRPSASALVPCIGLQAELNRQVPILV